MLRTIRQLFATALITAGLAVPLLAAPTAHALVPCTGGKDCVNKGADKVKTGATKSVGEIAKQITEILIFIIGAVSVIMIVIGAFKFVTSGGSAEQVKSAKNTILYAVVGLVIAVFAYAIVAYLVKWAT